MATVSSALKRWTTLEELEKTQTGPVWVLNSTDRRGEAGNLILSVPKLNGNGTDPVRVKRTFIPFDLTQQVPKVQLMGSSEFRSTVGKGDLRLCSVEYAQALLSTEAGKEEKRRIDNLMMQTQMDLDNANVVAQDEDEDEYFDPNNMDGENSTRRKAVETEVDKKVRASQSTEVGIKVQTLVAEAKEQGLSAVAIVGAIRRHGPMTKMELKFVAREFKSMEKVLAQLRKMKAKLKG